MCAGKNYPNLKFQLSWTQAGDQLSVVDNL